MKLIKPIFLLTLFISMVETKAYAYDAIIDGIYYIFSGTNAVVTYYSSNSYNKTAYSGNVTIPESVTYNGTNYSVTSIGSEAFYYCSGLTSVTIPNSVTSIGDWSFGNCSALTSVTIPNSVTSIGNSAFSGCSGLTSVTIPNSVTSIGNSAFAGCSSLTSVSVASSNAFYDSRNNCNAIIKTASNTLISGCKNTTIPNSVTCIGYWAFYKCSGLTNILIPNSVTSINAYAFYKCSDLTNITFSNSVTSIEDYAFAGCSGLTSVSIPNSVTSIDRFAFSGCSCLTSITIPNSVTNIGIGAFEKCLGLTSISVASSNAIYDSRNNCNAIIETASNTLISGCKNTTIPNSVTSIGDDAFSGCSGLTSITIPNSVTNIGGYAFGDCSRLTSITIPNSVTSIGDRAFYGCSSLTSMTFPNSVTSVKYGVFDGCSSLTNVTIGNSVTSIGESAFRDCSSLTSMTIPNSVTSIGVDAFYGCSGLMSITIPNSVTSIGLGAFHSCSSLTSVTIGESVMNIGSYAFGMCTNMELINSLSPQPPVCDTQALNGINKLNCVLRVPFGSKTAYQTADQWKDFALIVEIDGTQELTINTSATGYATFYSSESAYTLPIGLSAQVVTNASNDKLTYKTIADGSVSGVVPKGVAVMLVSDEKQTGAFTLTSSESALTYNGNNLLYGSDEAIITIGNGLHYKLSYGHSYTPWSDVFGWFWGAQDGAPFLIEANKAWLVVPPTDSSRTRGYEAGGDALSEIINSELMDNNLYYDLQGRRMSQPTEKGFYIKNGKVVVNK